MVFILRVLQITVRRVCGQRFAGVPFGAEHSLDLLAGILGVELVKDVDEGRHIVVHLVCAVHAVVDGDEADVVVREDHFRVHTHLEVIAPQTTHVLDDDNPYPSFVDQPHQTLPVGTVEIGPAVPVVHEIKRVGESVVIGVLLEDRFLRQDLSRVVSAKMIFSKNSKCDFITESTTETGYTTSTKTQGGILMRLKDKVAIITGGSRGIGYATADKFLKEGATVILTASSQGSADKAVAQLKEKYPNATVAGISPNLSNLESVRNAFREAASKYGCIDILVNNAGISESTPFTEYTEETFDKVMDLNVKGVFNATRAASECMIAKGQGVILSTSSMVSIYGQPSGFAYPASKFAVNGLTVSLARELGPKGIRVNAVAPGITLTDMMKAVPKEVIDPLIKQIPLRRLGQPEDIANAFVFLASDEASYITGVVLSVDGMART